MRGNAKFCWPLTIFYHTNQPDSVRVHAMTWRQGKVQLLRARFVAAYSGMM